MRPPTLRALLRALRRPPRRTAIALLALQAGIAFAPLAEPVDQDRAVAHLDEQGTSHRFAHNEATCAVCSLRTFVADVPAAAAAVAHAPGFRRAPLTATTRLATREFREDNPTRAPPTRV